MQLPAEDERSIRENFDAMTVFAAFARNKLMEKVAENILPALKKPKEAEFGRALNSN